MINTAHLSVESAPPLEVPFRFFLTAPLFGALFASILTLQGEGLFVAGRWYPLLIGALHLINLGVLVMVVSGVLFQMLPVVGGVQFPRFLLVSRLLHLSLTLGTLLLFAGISSGTSTISQWGFWVLMSGVVPYILLFMTLIFRVSQPSAWIVLLRYSAMFLLALVGLGMFLLLGWGSEQIPVYRQWTDVHAIWGLGGWFTLLLMTSSFQLIPMFQVTPEFPQWLKRWAVPLITAGLLLWGVGRIISVPFETGLTVAMFGISIYAVVTLNLLRQRKRKLFDSTVMFWQIALLALLLGSGFITVQQLRGETLPGWLAMFWIFIFLLPMLTGMLLKIAPFLVFLHMQQEMVRNPEQMGSLTALPTLFQILPVQWGKRLLMLFVATLAVALASHYLPVAYHLLGLLMFLFFISLQWIVYRCYRVYNTRAF